jgi:tetratricopeptide (TPR) repeat protein
MRKGEPDDHRYALFTDHWIRTRIDEPSQPRTSVAMEPYLPAVLAALPPADRAYYTARAISLHAHAVSPEAQARMWPLAETNFREAIGAGMSDPQAKFFLGKTLTAQGKHREAAEAYAAAYAAAPTDLDIALAHGQALLRARRPDDAERAFERATHDHPDAAGPLAELARARAGRGDYVGALELFRRAIALEPWTASMRVNAAMMLSALERHSEAIAESAEALRLDPEGPATWDAYAKLLSRAGRAADAERAARRAKDLGYAFGRRMNDVRAM